MKLSKKGTFGYIKKQRIIELIKTLFMIGLCAGTYFIGIYLTKSNKNLLTFVAILGCLPMAKFFVNFVLFTKTSGCSKELHDYLTSKNITPTFWDLFFTTYKEGYQVSALFYKKGCLIGITEDSKCNCELCEKHLIEILKNCGYENVTVKIFNDKEKYADRHLALADLEDEKDNSFLLDNIIGVSI